MNMDQTPVSLITTAPAAVEGYQPLDGDKLQDGKRLPLYNTKAAKVTGIMQITCGVFAFFLEIMMLLTLEYKNETDKVAVGVWGGPMFIATGIVGLLSAKKKRGMIVAYLVMSIISCVISGLGIIFASLHLADSYHFGHGHYNDVNWGACLILLVALIIEAIAGTFASSFGCASRICCETSTIVQERVVYMTLPDTSQAAVSGLQVPVEQPPAYISNRDNSKKV